MAERRVFQPLEVVEFLRRNRGDRNELPKLLRGMQLITPQWRSLEQRGALTSEHARALGALRTRAQELMRAEQRQLEDLMARQAQLRRQMPAALRELPGAPGARAGGGGYYFDRAAASSRQATAAWQAGGPLEQELRRSLTTLHQRLAEQARRIVDLQTRLGQRR